MYLYAFSKYTYDPVPDTVLWILSKHHILPVDGLFLHAEQSFHPFNPPKQSETIP